MLLRKYFILNNSLKKKNMIFVAVWVIFSVGTIFVHSILKQEIVVTW